MADLVLGLAKSAVEGTLTATKSAIEEEQKLKKSMQRDLHAASDEMLKTQVREVRNMALDVEDCIEFAVLVDVNKIRRWWWSCLIPSCMPAGAPVVTLNDTRNERYMHIGDATGGSKPAENDKTHQQAVADEAATVILKEAREAKRPDSPRDLVELINRKDDVGPLQVISVWGAAGDLGVASIIKKTCDHPKICSKFTCRAWVKLTQPFNPHEFLRSLMAQFYTNSPPQEGRPVDMLKQMDDMMAMEATQLTEEFLKQVTDHRCLIFLEDVSSMVAWEAVRLCLPDKKNGSCIVVHTQQLEVASLVVGESHGVLELEQFSAGHSVCAFFNEGEDKEMAIKKNNTKEWLRKNRLIDRRADKDWLSGSYPKVQTVFGMAGVGKSYIVRHVYYSEVIKDNTTFEKFGWVDITHPLNIRDFSWNLLLDLHSGSLQRACHQLLKKFTCLIVIDGLKSKEEWDSIKSALAFEHDDNGSCIIVIAYEESVAKYCSSDNWWGVEGLEIDEAFELFKNEASECPGSIWPSELSLTDNLIVKSVLHKCGGLPKVIVPMAKYIATNGWYPNLDYFMQLLETDQAFGSLKDLFSWVHSYFQSCPDDLKPCIFYLSIFPANNRIRRRRLVRRWIAEGYSNDTRESTAEEKGGEFFEDLCRRNMVHVPGSTNVSYVTRMSACQVNGFIREYIVSVEENLVFALEGNCSANSQRSGRHLTIGSTWDRDMSVYRSIDLSLLRSLTVFGKWEPSFISNDKVRLVRVLDLEDATSSSVTDGDLELIVKLLPRLNLRQLQTLDIRHTSIVKLPRSFTKLHKLQHISGGNTVTMDDYSSIVESPQPPAPLPEVASASSSKTPRLQLPRLWALHGQRLPTSSPNGGIELPRGIGKMMALYNISVIDISIASRRRPAAILEELKGLTQLRKFGVSGVNSENCKQLCSAIPGHPHLESSSVWFDKNQGGCLGDISPPPVQLKSLKLHGHVGKLPTWIGLLSNLRKLKLRLTMITQDDVDLMVLSRLSTLCLGFSEVQHGELRFCGDGMWCFRQLLILEIACNNKLKSVAFESSVMPWLEVLKIDCSNVSSLKFSGLQKQKDLREASLSGTYDDKVWQQLKSNLDEHHREIKPVLKPASPSGR
ncbi:hypothetical protein BS78_K068100 [Paspalum vaginatum]|uniref:NB-ARC domain-containing protein n=1 Tax=Paspalum vaginatum TaxID=158149 RepID=A0A9W7XDA1_9POAL|nr:hypothetical protein BS78_K068100 [Paspalum vaginatum]